METEKEPLDGFKDELRNILVKSQDNFEKQLSYISSGAIGASMLIVEKIFTDLSSTCWKLMVIIGWLLLALALVINLGSHLIAFYYHSNTIREIEGGKYDDVKALDRNKKIGYFNWISAFFLFAGIILIILFVAKNLLS